MHKLRSRGFTLIELLVVIAIIGILSAVILASLSTARTKGQDAAIQSDLNTVQTEAEIYYNGSGSNSYGATVSVAACPTSGSSMFVADTTIKSALAGIASNKGTTYCAVATGGTAYAVSTSNNSSGYFCVDSTGYSGTTSAQISTTHC